MSSAPLSTALSSLRNSTQTLSSSLAILDNGITDLPRISKVLAQTRHFELLPASTLSAAQADLVAEIAPEVDALLSRVEAEVERLERREQGLRAKWELQEGRLKRDVRGGASENANPSARATTKAGVAADSSSRDRNAPRKLTLGPRQELKAKQLRQKKERLSYAVERLTLQAQQTERQLRKSMAAQEMNLSKDDAAADDEDDDF